MRNFKTLCLLAFTLAICSVSALRAAMSPEESVASFKLADGVEAAVWASEPGMVNPTNIDIDARGRVWVCEGANYRSYMLRPEGDRIMILEDTKGDGKCDSYKVFVQDKAIRVPLGICVIGNKVYVSQSPSMLVYTIDASGDKPVGPPEVLFSGFTGINHDHGLHKPTFGPDGRIYFNSGNEGLAGAILKNSKGEVLLDSTGSNPFPKGEIFRGQPRKGIGYQQGMAFRCNPDGSDFETLGCNFRNNFEVAADSFGTAWQSDNDDDGNEGVRINYVMEGGNFGYTSPTTGHDWSRDKGLYPDQTRQEAHWHQRMPGVTPNLLHTGGGSPTGMIVYEGDMLPEKFRGALIHCDAGPNVVRAYITSPNGAGYKAESIEVIKAKDSWFRPSDVSVAPDGSVYVADWYDPGVGGHAMGDNKMASMRGRVYRLATPGTKSSVPKLDLETVPGQIAALCSPNLARRYEAYTKLRSGGAPALSALNELYKTSSNQRFRARALWLLARGEGGKEAVGVALKDQNVDIRITALRAARLIKMDMVAIAKDMLSDASPFVWRELCLAMNYEPTARCLDTLVALADKCAPPAKYEAPADQKPAVTKADKWAQNEGEREVRARERWYLEALGIACQGREKEVLEAWTANGKNKDPQVAEQIAWRLNKVVAAAVTPMDTQEISEWWTLGPFPTSGAMSAGLDKDYGIESKAIANELDYKASFKGVDNKDIKWELLKTADIGGHQGIDIVDLCQKRGFGTENLVMYFATTVQSPDEQKARLLLGSDDGIAVWLNGKPVHKNATTRALTFGEDTVDVQLKKGSNALLLKVEQGNGGSGVMGAVQAKTKVMFVK